MNFGFVIDNRSCIGCHACSTACKSENEVPLGVYRTWVKYTETGAWPEPQRHFQVTRCNHCSNPPCTRICPTAAMYQRSDGIVEFDGSACIGCKACMQACPYDAIYIDPETQTAAKCHYCSHRTDRGLEPACVVVCPTHAIISGDMDDPNSEISGVLSREKVTVRKPEQGTAPKLFYIEGSAVSMHPTAAAKDEGTFLWADVRDGAGQVRSVEPAPPPSLLDADRRAEPRAAQSQGHPGGGPIVFGGRKAEHMVQVSYNAQHKVPWHWPVPAYLVTKAIAAGVLMLLGIAWLSGLPFHAPLAQAGAAVSLTFLGLTTLLLVLDLEKPMRFLYILLRPQWRSWLTRGAVILIGTTLLTVGWLGLEYGAAQGWVDPSLAAQVRPWLLGVGVIAGLGTAMYTAFLFGQAEGRDLWQNPLLPVHLVAQAFLAGAASLILLEVFVPIPAELSSFLHSAFVLSVVVDLGLLVFGELGMPQASEVAARAAHAIHSGRYSRLFWFGAMVGGHGIPLLLVLLAADGVLPIAALLALVGLYCYEHAFVMAPQEIPNS